MAKWPHGYTYQYNSLWDPFWATGGPLPCVAARQPLGRIAIANADAAIDQAHRAVAELLPRHQRRRRQLDGTTTT